ncbi:MULTISPECIES: hypothetical protein [Sporolactobacillus]|uniref:Uncharacterized protein n=1 Tax=Sporolactobacillus nakayamae TaxID=269670 RepID=A0A1I2MXD3_9BACL|nr:hypothetical protein [Sporolactobacillus nakayamae]SFF96255.1 hypothetical protein SAMN02982927_00159 [Sporolactobacillus nakayamae]
MPIPQIRTVITTGQSMKNTYNQLAALRQEKKALQYQADQIHFHTDSGSGTESLTRIETSISGLNRQINQIQSEQSPASVDRMTISDTAYQLYNQIRA